jgi:hypothetical protein
MPMPADIYVTAAYFFDVPASWTNAKALIRVLDDARLRRWWRSSKRASTVFDANKDHRRLNVTRRPLIASW